MVVAFFLDITDILYTYGKHHYNTLAILSYICEDKLHKVMQTKYFKSTAFGIYDIIVLSLNRTFPLFIYLYLLGRFMRFENR